MFKPVNALGLFGVKAETVCRKLSHGAGVVLRRSLLYSQYGAVLRLPTNFKACKQRLTIYGVSESYG